MKLSLVRAPVLFVLSLAVLVACSASPDLDLDLDDLDPDVDDEAANEAVATSTDAATGRRCYCAGAHACGHSRSPTFMYSKARTALAAAGVSTSTLTQTYGDAPASVGTHCPEPGTAYSAATDLQSGASPCTRTRALRMQGFAAWFRTAPEFPGNLHIHAVYAGAPGMKASLQRQVDSFLQGRNGLARNGVETHCPITAAEIAAVRRVRAGGGGGGATTGRCVTGGSYCGGDKLVGDANTLYRCNVDGTGTVIQRCVNGCAVNTGRDDSCK